ncbi:hypothetical protein XENOCAPTIV_007812, partial [Xenoophorus captivus]
GNGGTAPSSTEEGHEDFVGGTYVRFDAPKAKIRKTWPSVRGTPCFNLVLSLFSYPLTIGHGWICVEHYKQIVSHQICTYWCICVCSTLPDMILHRYVVSRVIWTYMLSIAVTYSITLCLFPGLESEIRNPTLGEWLPILIMATFNMSDFVGKVSRHFSFIEL